MNLYLIGYRGSGKSSVAPLVAKRLNSTTIDTDDRIETVAGKKISVIFADHGEPEFRRLETQAIRELSEPSRASTSPEQAPHQSPIVISLGGGAPVALENRKILGATGKVIYLKASAEELWRRISGDAQSADRRPDLTDQGGLAEVQEMLTAREPIYSECADFIVDAETQTPEEIALAIHQWWERSEA